VHPVLGSRHERGAEDSLRVSLARYRAAVGNVPYPVQAIWGADDPAMTLAVYGEKARAAAGLAEVATVPGKHFPQEDQAPAIARKIAEQALWPPPARR
jgi:pimeloyl-ACP methyl ester carboxylesterase